MHAQSCLTLCDPWTVAHQAPLFMEFSRQEYWSGLPFSPPGDLPNQGTEHESSVSPTLQAYSLPLSHWGNPSRHTGEAHTDRHAHENDATRVLIKEY